MHRSINAICFSNQITLAWRLSLSHIYIRDIPSKCAEGLGVTSELKAKGGKAKSQGEGGEQKVKLLELGGWGIQ